MKQYGRNGLFVAVCTVIFVSALAASAFAGPRIEVDQRVHDFGQIWEDVRPEHVFTVSNKGDEELVIRYVKTSCGCVAAKFDRSIAPGKTGTVKVSMKIRNVQAQVTETATIFSNDPNTPRLKLAMSYSVKSYISVKPWDFIRLTHVEGMKSSRAIRFETHEDGPLELSSPQMEGGLTGKIETRLIPGEDRKSWVVEVTSSFSERGTYKGRIDFHTNSKHKPDIRIPLVLTVTGPVRVTPPKVAFGTLSEDDIKTKKRPVLLSSVVEGQELKILGVEYDKNLLKVEVEDKSPGKEYMLYVSLNLENPTKGKIEQKILVKTNVARMSTIEIPVRAYLLLK